MHINLGSFRVVPSLNNLARKPFCLVDLVFYPSFIFLFFAGIPL